MAKKRKLTPGGPPKGKIVVYSNTWGTHERFARGTHKPAPVNDAFKKASSTLHQANRYASLINSAIKPFNRDIKDGTLWSRLTKHFYPFVESKTPVDYRGLAARYRPEGAEGSQRVDKNGKVVDLDFPIHKHHRLSHTLRYDDLEMIMDPDKKKLQISLKGLHISFTNAIPDIDGAHLTMIALYVDDRNEYVETRHQAAMLELNETEVYFELPIPPNTGVVLLCLKCQAYHNGGLSGNLRTMGMDFVKVELLNDIAVNGVVTTPDVEVGTGSASAVIEVTPVENESTPAGTEVISAINEYGAGGSEVIPVENEDSPAGTDVISAINEYGTGATEGTSLENEVNYAETEAIASLNEYGSGSTEVIPAADEVTTVSIETASKVTEVSPAAEAVPVSKKSPRVAKAKGPGTSSHETKGNDEATEKEEDRNQLSLW